MTQETVDRMLKDYNHCVARRDHLITAIDELTAQRAREQSKAMIQEALHGAVMNGMPHGSNPGNPVESLVLRYASGYQPQYIQQMDADIRMMQDDLKELKAVCSFGSAWLLAVNDKARILVVAAIIDGLRGAETVPLLQQKYPGTFTGSRSGLREMQRRALEKIYDVAS